MSKWFFCIFLSVSIHVLINLKLSNWQKKISSQERTKTVKVKLSVKQQAPLDIKKSPLPPKKSNVKKPKKKKKKKKKIIKKVVRKQRLIKKTKEPTQTHTPESSSFNPLIRSTTGSETGGKSFSLPTTSGNSGDGTPTLGRYVEAVDLSQDAQLIISSISKPEYTEDALEFEIEGVFLVEVFIDNKGIVKEVILEKKIGYGMDQRVISAAKKARFTPRKDIKGKAISTWSEIRFVLKIE